ncbi:MAG: hypothetical protein ABGW74_09615 [Campylobacterales bacterium]
MEKSDKVQREKKALEEAIKAEQKYAQEQKFYQGDEYDLKSKEVDPSTIQNIKGLEPENDFDMDDVYD